MTYEVILIKSDEGYAVGCPALRGCWSQGETEADALENIRDAITEYLASFASEDDAARLEALREGGQVREVVL